MRMFLCTNYGRPMKPSFIEISVFRSWADNWGKFIWDWDLTVNDRKCVFHFRPKSKPKSEKHLVFGRIPKPKVQIYVKKGGNFAKFQVSNDISN